METAEARLLLTFNAAKVLKDESASIFDPLARSEPAQLRLHRVKAVAFDADTYQLNSTVVDFGASPSGDDDLVEFYFDLTGGMDPGAFLVRFKVVAHDFDLGPVHE